MAEVERISGARTLWELVERRAAATPDRPVLIDAAERVVTFKELRDRAERVAAGLAAMGIGEGSRVSWQLPSSIETVLVMLGLSRLGAVQNPVIHLYREREVGFALRQTRASMVVIPGTWRGTDYRALVARSIEGSGLDPAILDLSQGLPDADPADLGPAPAGLEPDEAPVRWVYYTSGSTSDPKGVQHTDQTLIAGGWGLVVALEIQPDDVGSIAFPFAHIAGPDYLVALLAVGFHAVIVDAFVLPEVLPLYRRHGVTMVGGSTAFYVAFLAEQRKQPGRSVLPTLRHMSGGGAPKPPNLHAEVRDEIGGRGVVHGYGMTEVPMIANNSPSDTDEQLAYTDGRPVEGAEVRIVRADGTEAPTGEEGEIRVRGPMVFRGYTDPVLNAEAFDAQGWFRTGDLGRLRPDGHVCITGRLKDVIVRKGENVSAKEVEDVLAAHPAVAEVAVIGLPDPERGERVCAVVELRAGASLSLDEVVRHCRAAGLMTQKIPEQLEVRTDWPRGGTGKILKRELKAQYGS
jgi:acyl-CoA synthetase (AMP-forming)/AMP-acid ligase II